MSSEWTKCKVATIMLIFAVSTTLATQGFLQKKEFKEWKQDECLKVLRDSPWASRFEIKNVHLVPIGAETADSRREPNPEYSYAAQFRSALPIRQAMVRLRQIQMKYDSLDTENRKAFDAQTAQFLDQKFEDRIVLVVQFQSNIDGALRDAIRIWQSLSTEQLRNEVYLNVGKGKKTELDRFSFSGTGGQCEFVFEFPRTRNGEPLVTEDDKTVNLEFRHPDVVQFPAGRVFIEFKLRDMKFKNVLTL